MKAASLLHMKEDEEKKSRDVVLYYLYMPMLESVNAYILEPNQPAFAENFDGGGRT